MDPWQIAGPSALAGLAGLTGYAARHPRSYLFGPTIFRTDAPRKLALTFDDGPNPAVTPKLLDLLELYNARSTFFIIGKFVRESPGLTKEILARGHVLGNHTDTHPNLFFCDYGETREELQRCNDALLSATWETPRFFRPPYGLRSPWVCDIANDLNMRTVTWTLLPGDWRPKPLDWLVKRMQPIATNAQRLNAHSANAANRGTGDILCLHDGDAHRANGDRTRTLAALEFWLPRWRDLGLEFVTMSQAAEGSA